MKQLVPAIIAGVFIVAGGAGGFYLKNSGSADASTASSGHGEKAASDGKSDGGHGEKDDGHGKAKKNDGHGGSSEASGDTLYYKFSREFVIPIIGDDRVRSMVILNLNLEIESSVSQKLFSMEPKLRDNIMTTLINLSNDSDALNDPTNPENYEAIRSAVLVNLRTIVPEGIDSVLIQDMAKQDM